MPETEAGGPTRAAAVRTLVALACAAAAPAAAAAQATEAGAEAPRAPVSLTATGSFAAHGGNFTAVAFDAESRAMLTCGERGDVAVWDLPRGEVVRTLPALGERPLCAAVSPDATRAVLSFGGRRTGTWAVDLDTGRSRLLTPDASRAAAFAPGGASVAWIQMDRRGSVLVVARADRLTQPMARIDRLGEAVLGMACDSCSFDRDGAHVVVSKGRHSAPLDAHLVFDASDLGRAPAHRPGRLLGWTDAGQPIVALVSYSLRIGARTLAPKAHWRVASHHGQVASLEDSYEGKVERHTGKAQAFSLGSRLDGFEIAPDGTIAAWDPRGRLHLIRDGTVDLVTAHLEPDVAELSFSADGRFVAAAGTGGVTIGDVRGASRKTLVGRYGIAPGQAGPEFLLADRKGLHRFHAATGRDIGDVWTWSKGAAVEFDYDTFGGPDENAQRLRTVLPIDTGDSYLLRQGLLPRVTFFDPRAGVFRPVRDEAHPLRRGQTVQVAWSAHLRLAFLIETSDLELSSGDAGGPGGRIVRTAGSHALRQVDARGEVLVSRTMQSAPRTLALAPDGRRLLLSTSDLQLALLDGKDLRELAQAKLPARLCWCEFLTDDLALAHDGMTMFAFDARELTRIGEVALPPGEQRISATALSPDRRRLALARGGLITVFEIRRR